MRITGGVAKGIPLKAPRGDVVRPATDRMREAVFSFLAGRMEGAVFADLFAGSGSYGLEALSRGAAGGFLVEKNRRALAVLRENLNAVARSLGHGAASARVVAADVLKWKPGAGEKLDLVFCDPPYEQMETVAPLVVELMAMVLKPGGLLVFEMPGSLEVSADGFTLLRRLGKGRHDPTCVIWQKDEPSCSTP